MPKIVGTEWFNENENRNYPLSQSATAKSINADTTIPDNFLVDLKLAVPYIPGFHPTGFYISGLTLYPQGLVITFGYKDNTKTLTSIATSVPITYASFEKYNTYTINGLQTKSSDYDFSQIYGFVTIGSVDNFKAINGKFDFDVTGTRLESTTISFGIKRISGMRVVNNGAETGILQGQIVLRSGSNHQIIVNSENNAKLLTFNAITTTGFVQECGCNDVALGPPIRTINNKGPDASGNFTISAGDCVSVDSSGTGLVLNDTCAKPCCGCTELSVLNQDLELLRTQVQSLSSFAGNLFSQMQTLQTTALGSSFTPESCAPESSGCSN